MSITKLIELLPDSHIDTDGCDEEFVKATATIV